ncbi:Rieske (2Fe-2S) protein [Enterobacterales bacterium AW_CKDN230030176-1A_HGKHYDSX7]
MPSTASPVSATDERPPSPGMTLLCRSEALPEGASRLFECQDTTLFAVRYRGRAYVYVNRCPHRHVPLHWQDGGFLDDSGSLIRCARHGALFLIEDGECVTGPCEAQRLQPVECLETAGSLWGATTALPAADDR